MSIGLVLPVLLLVLLTLGARTVLGAWSAPGAFFPLYWTALIVGSVLVADYPLWSGGVWWMLACLAAFSLGSLATQGMVGQGTRAPEPRRLELPHARVIIVACVILGLLYIVFREPVSGDTPETPPKLFQVLLSAMWLAPLLGGMLCAAAQDWRGRMIGLLGLFPTFAYGIAHTGRSPILAGIFFWAGGFLSAGVLVRRGAVRVVTLRVALLIPLVVSALVFVAMSISAMRQASVGPLQQIPLSERLLLYPTLVREWDFAMEWQKFRSAVLGHPYSFSYYFSRAIDYPPNPQFGALMFGGLLELAGLRDRAAYESFEVDPEVMSNTYTLFMPPIEDFGFTGALASFLVSGLIAGWAYRRVVAGGVLPIPVLAMFYPHVLVIGGYFFSYNSQTLTFVALAAYLWWYRGIIIRATDTRAGAVLAIAPPWRPGGRPRPLPMPGRVR